MTPGQARRYVRHTVLPDIGDAGQSRLLQSQVAVIGCGGLGSAASGYLAAMGVGRLRVIDGDRVELSNLQRQLLFETADIGAWKVHAARARIEELTPDVLVDAVGMRLDATNAAALIKDVALVVDASDNFETRLAIHAACLEAHVPLVYGALSGTSAQLTTFKGYEDNTPCLQCYLPGLPERAMACTQEGVLGALAGVVGAMQAAEAVKELLGIGDSLSGRLLRYDALAGDWRSSILLRDPACSAVGHGALCTA